MTNHLRIALKHLLATEKVTTDIILENYSVSFKLYLESTAVAMNHLQFNGWEEFHICLWNMQSKTLYVCESENCPVEEIIYVLRTIKKLGLPTRNSEAPYKNY
jgi:hypothetical protein